METQDIINTVLGVALTLSGWILRTIWDAVKSLQNDLRQIEREIPKIYVRRDDYKDDMSEIKTMLHAIFDKLEGKADK